MKKILATMLSVGVCTSAFASSEGFDEYLNKLRAEARDKGISEQVISAAFANVEYKPRAVKADRNQPEKKLTLDEYIPRAVPEWKVNRRNQNMLIFHVYSLTKKGAGQPPHRII